MFSIIRFCPFLLLFNIALGLPWANGVRLQIECDGDTQCLPGYFCYTKTKTCSLCIDCKAYNRGKVSWRSCAKEPDECGDCLPGYDAEVLAGGRKREWCLESKQQPSAHHSDAVQTTQNYLTWPLGIGFFVILTLFYAACWKNWRGGNMNRLAAQTEQPPPYSTLDLPSATHNVSSSSNDNESGVSCACSCSSNSNNHNNSRSSSSNSMAANAISRLTEISNPRQVSLSWQQCKEQSLVQAVPFRFPEDSLQHSLNPLLDDDSDISDHESIADDQAVALSQDRSIELEDETTMPSDWTPYPCHVDNEEEASAECQDSCDNVDSGNVESVSEPPTKKRKGEEETAAASETADN